MLQLGHASSSLTRLLLLGLALCTAQIDISAQPAPATQSTPANAAEMPKDPLKFMDLARKSNGLTAPELPPWHLKVTFTLFDVLGKPIDHGTYEEFTDGPTRDKYSVADTSFAIAGYQNGKHEALVGPYESAPDLFWLMREAFVDPFPRAEIPYRYTQVTQTSNSESIHLSCLSAIYLGGFGSTVTYTTQIIGARTPQEAASIAQMNTLPIPKAPQRTTTEKMWDSRLCFDQDKPLVRLISDSLGMRTIRNNVFLFDGKYVPRDVFIGENGKVELNAHLEILEEVKPESIPDFEIPKNAAKEKHYGIEYLPLDKVQKLQTQFATPSYPPATDAAHVVGTVHIRAVIGLDGQVHSSHVLDGPLQLQQAALDAVNKYRFKPLYDANEKQYEIGTVFEITFPPDHN